MINFIKQAYKTLVKGDTSAYPQGQSKYNDKTTDYNRLSVYGLCSNAPVGSHVLLIGSQGQESTKFGIENDFLNRLKGLKEGEVALYNTLTQSLVLLKENGDIRVTKAAGRALCRRIVPPVLWYGGFALRQNEISGRHCS